MLTYLLLKRRREERESDISDEDSVKSLKSCPDEEKQESNGRLPTSSNRQDSTNPVVQPMSDSILNEEEDSTLQDEELGLRARRCKVPDSLTEDQEDALAEWFQSQPLFFDQSVRDFKNKDKRERLLEEKARDFGLQGKDIMLWFKSQRTIYGRLKKKKSGLAPQSLTARQRWVLRTFSFLSPYLIARSSRNLAKHNHALEMRVDDDSWDEDVAQLDISQYDLHPGPLRLPESIASEEELLNMSGTPVRADLRAAFIKQENPDDSTEHTTETLPRNHHLQPPTSEVLYPRRSSSNSPRTAWANWLSAEVMELPEELWRKFQRESFELVMRYKEQQQSTEDLKVTKLPNLSAIRDVIYTSVREWIIKMTDIKLSTQVDMSCAMYSYTDVLSCHDDELDDRRVAFIYYLVPESWNAEDGGRLQLFSLDDNGEPKEIIKNLIPVQNSFVFFEVTPASFHQVEEVLTEDKTRLSISGWFHGPRIDRPSPYMEAPPTASPSVSIEEDDFYSWLNPQYLDSATQASIKETFVEESQIELSNFLQENMYEELASLLSGIDRSKWSNKGPPNKRNYMSIDVNELPDHVTKCLKFLQSDALFLILSSLTGLKLHELAEVSDSEEEEEQTNQKGDSPLCHCEVRKWQHGSYTLVHDTDAETKHCALDAVLYIGCGDWQTEYGGITSYIAKGEDEELLSVCPTPNSLALVYRDTETLKFVKHINARVRDTPNKGFMDISCVYYE